MRYVMHHWLHLCLLCICLAKIQGKAATSSGHVQTDGTYSIEIRIFVDKWAFTKWNATAVQQTTPDTEINRTKTTQDIMRNHIRAILNGVNNIYAGLEEYGISLDVRVDSIHFIMDEVVAESTERSGEVSNKKVLAKLATWLEKREDTPVDHIMLLTGLNITGNYSDADSLGVANLGEMCEKRSLSVVEFLPPGGETTLVIAHEIGHSLNASHDGEGNMTCTNNSYVMDSRVNRNSTNSYIFSPCSAHSIQQFLQHLNSQAKGSCLSEDKTRTVSDRSAPTLASLISLDQLCQMELGPHSFLHRASYGDNITLANYSTVCTSVWCSVTHNLTTVVVSADGFVCGNNKVCRLGMCVQSEDGIDVPDSCPYGDAPPYAKVHKNYTCSDLAVTPGNSSLCYQQFYQGACCHSCASAFIEMPDCEYGDKATWCATSEYPDVCNENDNICCASCLPLFNESRVGCEYGDKASWCASAQYPYVCDLNAEICCESCLQYYNESRTGCEYGDKAEWCATVNYPTECYGNDDMCCLSCAQYHNASHVGCEYGDKAAWCSTLDYPRECYRNDNSCCASCLQHFNTSRPNCEYGDKAKWCTTMDIPRECYGNDEACCGSCLDHRNDSNADCEYGDKADWCEDADYPYACSLNARVCCGSCRQYYNESNIGCEYGDKTRGCESLTLPRDCYKNAHLCCHTCQQYYQPSATGCEYGDKATWCQKKVAKDRSVCELNSEVCCASCAHYQTSHQHKTNGQPNKHADKRKDEL